jgi:hypothetical protein
MPTLIDLPTLERFGQRRSELEPGGGQLRVKLRSRLTTALELRRVVEWSARWPMFAFRRTRSDS